MINLGIDQWWWMGYSTPALESSINTGGQTTNETLKSNDFSIWYQYVYGYTDQSESIFLLLKHRQKAYILYNIRLKLYKRPMWSYEWCFILDVEWWFSLIYSSVNKQRAQRTWHAPTKAASVCSSREYCTGHISWLGDMSRRKEH